MTIWEIVAETEQRVGRAKRAAEQAAKRKGKGEKIEAPLADELVLGLGLSTTNRHWGFLRQLTTWFDKHHPLSPLDYSAFIANDDRDARKQRDA